MPRTPREEWGHLHPQTRIKKTAPTATQVGREDAEWNVSKGPLPSLPVRVYGCLHSLILRCWGVC